MARSVQPARSCGTCRHFEPSSVLGEGWCRNPKLYGPQHSHRVEQDDLDCSHGLGDHWEPMVANAGVGAARLPRPAETGDDAVSAGPRDPFSSQEPERPARAASTRGRGAPEGGRLASQPAEERYWTDYLRVALPVLGLLLLIGLLWYWASAIIGNGSAEAPKTPVVVANVTPIEPATPPPPAAEPPPPAIQPTPGLPAPTVPPAIIPPTQPPAIPSRPVDTQPRCPVPGTSILATQPTMRPRTIIQMMLMTHSLDGWPGLEPGRVLQV